MFCSAVNSILSALVQVHVQTKINILFHGETDLCNETMKLTNHKNILSRWKLQAGAMK